MKNSFCGDGGWEIFKFYLHFSLFFLSLFVLFPLTIDTVSNLVFWTCLVNKLELWHIVYIMQQKQNTLILT